MPSNSTSNSSSGRATSENSNGHLHPSKNLVARTSTLYCFFQASIGLLLWVPIFYSYQINHGISEKDYFQIQSLYYFIFCLLELPTGFISDRWGHRKTLLLSSLIMAASNLFAIFMTNYIGFLLQFFSVALARSLFSGAASAYLYEFLQKNNEVKKYKEVEGKARSYSLLGRVIGWASVGYMMKLEATLPFWGTFIACLVAFFCVKAFPKETLSSWTFQWKNLNKDIWQSLKPIPQVFRSQKNLLWLMLLGAGVFVLVRLTQVNLYQPILQRKSFDISIFGWLMSAMTLAEAFGARVSISISKKIKDLHLVAGSTLFVCVSLVLVTLTKSHLTIAAFMLFAFFSGCSELS